MLSMNVRGHFRKLKCCHVPRQCAALCTSRHRGILLIENFLEFSDNALWPRAQGAPGVIHHFHGNSSSVGRTHACVCVCVRVCVCVCERLGPHQTRRQAVCVLPFVPCPHSHHRQIRLSLTTSTLTEQPPSGRQQLREEWRMREWGEGGGRGVEEGHPWPPSHPHHHHRCCCHFDFIYISVSRRAFFLSCQADALILKPCRRNCLSEPNLSRAKCTRALETLDRCVDARSVPTLSKDESEALKRRIRVALKVKGNGRSHLSDILFHWIKITCLSWDM